MNNLKKVINKEVSINLIIKFLISLNNDGLNDIQIK
jgi:hypothetical protein